MEGHWKFWGQRSQKPGKYPAKLQFPEGGGESGPNQSIFHGRGRDEQLRLNITNLDKQIGILEFPVLNPC